MKHDEQSWVEKTEHFYQLQAEANREESPFIHKDEIEWLLIKERGDAMVFMFFVAPIFWGTLAIILYAFFA